MTPADLIKTRTCSPRCLLADPVRKCRCACKGQHHGLLLTADVTALLEARRVGLHHLTDRDIVATY